MWEPLTISSDEETQQVTVIICHTVRSGREQRHEEWLQGITTAAHKNCSVQDSVFFLG